VPALPRSCRYVQETRSHRTEQLDATSAWGGLHDLKRPERRGARIPEGREAESRQSSRHYNLGNFYLAKGRRDDALSEFRRATELTPRSRRLGELLVDPGELGSRTTPFRATRRRSRSIPRTCVL